jgi:glycosyltransferase involved in cell wall biosynthesis
MRSEDEIIKNWIDKTKPLVSVICPAYNHEKYIGQAIESFLSQETDFAFEVIIHDDASTDLTVSIVSEYKNKYPKIIQVVLQKVNQYSKGFKISPILLPYTKGKYIAFCEGDDYWIDPKKLKKQVDILNNNKQYIICGHLCINVDEHGRLLSKQLYTGEQCPQIFDIKNSLKATPVHPNTWMYRRIDWKDTKYFTLLNTLPAGDDTMMLMLLSTGKGYCIKEYCSAYRLHSGGSWSTKAEYHKNFAMLQFYIGSLYLISNKMRYRQFLNILNSSTKTIKSLLYAFFKIKDIKPFFEINDSIYKQKIAEPYIFFLLLLFGILLLPLWFFLNSVVSVKCFIVNKK